MPSRDEAEDALALVVAQSTRTFLQQVLDAVLAAIRHGRTDEAQPVLALGVLLGWWTDVVGDRVVESIKESWQAAFGVTLAPGSTVTARADAMAFHITAVRDRLSRSALPEIPEAAFDDVRLSQSAAALGGWPIDKQARDIAERLAWEPDKKYWKDMKAEAEAEIDKVLDPLGKPGTPARTYAHQNDPQVKFWQGIRAQAVDKIKEDEGDWQVRATRIARTEATAAWNSGALAALAAEGRTHKKWLATTKGPSAKRTRESHLEANGQVVPLARPFRVGESLLMMPGDPSGPPWEVINCRCTVVGADDPGPSVLVASHGPEAGTLGAGTTFVHGPDGWTVVTLNTDAFSFAGNNSWRDQLRVPKGNGSRSGRWTFTPWKHLDDVVGLVNALGGASQPEARAAISESLRLLEGFNQNDFDPNDRDLANAATQIADLLAGVPDTGDQSLNDGLAQAGEGIRDFAETDWTLFDEDTDIDGASLGRATNKNVWEGDLPGDVAVNPDLADKTSQWLKDELDRIKNHPVAPSPTARRKRAMYLKELNDRRDRDEQGLVEEETDITREEETDITRPEVSDDLTWKTSRVWNEKANWQRRSVTGPGGTFHIDIGEAYGEKDGYVVVQEGVDSVTDDNGYVRAPNQVASHVPFYTLKEARAHAEERALEKPDITREEEVSTDPEPQPPYDPMNAYSPLSDAELERKYSLYLNKPSSDKVAASIAKDAKAHIDYRKAHAEWEARQKPKEDEEGWTTYDPPISGREVHPLQVGDVVRKTQNGKDWYVVGGPHEVSWGGDPEENPHTIVYTLALTPGARVTGNAGYAQSGLFVVKQQDPPPYVPEKITLLDMRPGDVIESILHGPITIASVETEAGAPSQTSGSTGKADIVRVVALDENGKVRRIDTTNTLARYKRVGQGPPPALPDRPVTRTKPADLKAGDRISLPNWGDAVVVETRSGEGNTGQSTDLYLDLGNGEGPQQHRVQDRQHVDVTGPGEPYDLTYPQVLEEARRRYADPEVGREKYFEQVVDEVNRDVRNGAWEPGGAKQQKALREAKAAHKAYQDAIRALPADDRKKVKSLLANLRGQITEELTAGVRDDLDPLVLKGDSRLSAAWDALDRGDRDDFESQIGQFRLIVDTLPDGDPWHDTAYYLQDRARGDWRPNLWAPEVHPLFEERLARALVSTSPLDLFWRLEDLWRISEEEDQAYIQKGTGYEKFWQTKYLQQAATAASQQDLRAWVAAMAAFRRQIEGRNDHWGKVASRFEAIQANGEAMIKEREAAAEETLKESYGTLDMAETTPQAVIARVGMFYATRTVNNNCVLASTVYELRRRGIDVHPKQARKGRNSTASQRAWFNASTDPYGEIVVDGLKGRQSKGRYEAIVKHVKANYQPGNRGTIRAGWKGRSFGHIWNWEVHDDGSVVFYDGQTGEVIDGSRSDYWGEMDWRFVTTVRLDHLPLRPDIEVVLAPKEDTDKITPEMLSTSATLREMKTRRNAIVREMNERLNKIFKMPNGPAKEEARLRYEALRGEYTAHNRAMDAVRASPEAQKIKEVGNSFPFLDPNTFKK